MKYRVTALLLIVCFMGSGFSRFFVYAGFELNRHYIATKLCENRNKPWLHCNGKCYFMKKMKEADDKQAAGERETQKNLLQETYFETAGQVKFFTRVIGILHVSNSRIQLPQGHSSILRPPQLG